MTKVLKYFVLWNPGLYGGGGKQQPTSKPANDLLLNLLLYIGTAIGVFGQQLLSGEEAKLVDRITLETTIRSFIVAAVILPVLYKNTDMHRRKPGFFRFFVCIQHGYFWPQIVSSVGSAFQSS